MSKTAWTPGPWIVTQAYGAGCVNIMASGNELAVSGRSRRAQANRALIADAPAMAEALEALASAFMSHTQWSGEPPAEVVNARAILARIKGEAGR